MIEVWFDGSCGPRNPGGAMGYGVVIRRDGVDICLETASLAPHPENTNNLAEYLALEWALLHLAERGLTSGPLVIRGDSRLVIRQMFPVRKGKRWKIKAGAYATKAREVRVLLERFSNVRGEWVPRERNDRADRLSKCHSERLVIHA